MVRCTYAIPDRLSGVAQAPLVKAVNAAPPGSPPLRNAQFVAPVAVVVSCRLLPAGMTPLTAAGAVVPVVWVRAAKGVMARLEPVGQDEMKPAARVKTPRIPSGVSNAEGMAAAFDAVRMNVWWRASTVTISAATVRIPGVLTRGAAARYLDMLGIFPRVQVEKTYAETPMFSNTPAVATMAAAVVNPKLYVHG